MKLTKENLEWLLMQMSNIDIGDSEDRDNSNDIGLAIEKELGIKDFYHFAALNHETEDEGE